MNPNPLQRLHNAVTLTISVNQPEPAPQADTAKKSRLMGVMMEMLKKQSLPKSPEGRILVRDKSEQVAG